MKIILCADLDNLGQLGQEVAVKPGYGRNYLIPQGLAMLATASNRKVFDLQRRNLQQRNDSIKGEAQELANKLAAVVVKLIVRVGENDKLYGAITTSHIAHELESMGIKLDRRKLMLDTPIRTLGEYLIPVKLHPSVQSALKVCIEKYISVSEQMVIDEIAAAEAAAAAEKITQEEQTAVEQVSAENVHS